MEIINRKEAKEKGLAYYFTGNPCKQGHISKRRTVNGSCHTCFLIGKKKHRETHRDEHKAYMKEWHVRNKEQQKEYGKQHYIENREWYLNYAAQYRENNPEKVKNAVREWRKLNPEYHVLKGREYYRNNKEWFRDYWKQHAETYNARASLRRARIVDAHPSWVELSDIEHFYIMARTLTELTGVPHEVDHIIPLNNDTVCGLHVPDNLRVVSMDYNRSKGNKYETN